MFPMQGLQIRSVVRELRSHIPCSVDKLEKNMEETSETPSALKTKKENKLFLRFFAVLILNDYFFFMRCELENSPLIEFCSNL